MDISGSQPLIGTHRVAGAVTRAADPSADRELDTRTNSLATSALYQSTHAPSSSKSYNRIVRLMKIHVEYKSLTENDNRTPDQNKRLQQLIKETRKEKLEAQVTEYNIIDAIEDKTPADLQRLNVLDEEISHAVTQNFQELHDSYNNPMRRDTRTSLGLT